MSYKIFTPTVIGFQLRILLMCYISSYSLQTLELSGHCVSAADQLSVCSGLLWKFFYPTCCT